MKKLVLFLILILSVVSVRADEIKNYYIENNIYYLLFCPNDIDELKIQGDGEINFEVNSDIENSKNFITLIALGNSELNVSILAEDKKYLYNIISKTNARETCDDTLIKLDAEALPPANAPEYAVDTTSSGFSEDMDLGDEE